MQNMTSHKAFKTVANTGRTLRCLKAEAKVDKKC